MTIKKAKRDEHPFLHEIAVVKSLPTEILVEIFSYLPHTDLLNVELVCLVWYSAIKASRLWIKLLSREVGNDTLSWSKAANFYNVAEEMSSTLSNLRAKQLLVLITQMLQNIKHNYEDLTPTVGIVSFSEPGQHLSAITTDNQLIVVVFQCITKVWNRRTLSLKTVIKNNDNISEVLSLNNGCLVFRTWHGKLNMYCLETGTWLTPSFVHLRGGVVTALAFHENILISRTLPHRREANASVIAILHFEGPTKMFSLLHEICLANTIGFGMGFDGDYLVFLSVEPRTARGHVQVRAARENWELLNQLLIPYQIGSKIIYQNKLILIFLVNEFRVFQVETAMCILVSPLACGHFESSKFFNVNYPFVITCLDDSFDSFSMEMQLRNLSKL